MVAVAIDIKESHNRYFLYQNAVKLMTSGWSYVDQIYQEGSSYKNHSDALLSAIGVIAQVKDFFIHMNTMPSHIIEDAPFWHDVCNKIEVLLSQLDFKQDGHEEAKALLFSMLLDIKKVFNEAALYDLL
jgi:hypothetical protein